jgi:DNA-binding XRE family transcriptional regulator
LVLAVRVLLRASKPEFRCEQGDPLPAQLRGRRHKLGLTVAEAAKLVGVGQWTFGMWENGRPRGHVGSSPGPWAKRHYD